MSQLPPLYLPSVASLKDKEGLKEDSEELDFINNEDTRIHALTLEHAAGSHDVPESDYRFMIEKRTKKLEREELQG